MDQQRLRLYDYAASANCLKVRILLAQLGLAYERIPVDIFGGDTLTDEYYEKNPARTTPLLEIGDGTYLRESGAILWYLADGTELVPDDPVERARVLGWLLFEQAELVPSIGGLRFRLLTGRLAADDQDAVRRRKLSDDVLGTLEAGLAGQDFLVGGRYSIGDIALYAYTHAAPDAGIALDPYPAVEAWLRRVEATPRFVNDLVPYPENARAGASRSIYD